MAPHENVFYTEKYLNDSLHNPQREGLDHSSKEIASAARLLGRASVVADETTKKKLERKNATNKLNENLLKNSNPLGDGMVLVKSGESVRRINVNEVVRGGEEEDVESKHHRKRKFDSDSRWKTEERIKNGGTGGQKELNAARNAASELERKKGRGNEEDVLPVVVLPSGMVFGSDGFVKNSTDDDKNNEEMKTIAIARRKAKEISKRDVKRKAKSNRFIDL